ncbi:DUF481 domain-containing protein [Lentiprolixibacter aurantiacus]|uniref:DUF481 domain-containing protein n=1 Tax=Lentiprolixibacter aurantiacus TaxID=2993939 RepID=A0AAE3MMK7_9FLAO|nr:DUF481 domain-containing protein [Lentiprolixibacter aurantiacus]MCX2720610.1 DUF481 domain-containing protein [Lentiprolixibacter aurantiacus]
MGVVRRFYFTAIALFVFLHITYSQADSLVLDTDHKEFLVGEIKKMERSVLEIDAPYGDENFKIKWSSIREIYTQSKFVVSIKDRIYRGRLASLPDQKIKIFDNDTIYATCKKDDIVYLNPFKEKFSDRFGAMVEAGFNVTKAQDLRQFSLRSSISYKTDKWTADASYNIIRSSQDNVEPVKRTDGLLNYRRILPKNWYLIGTIATLSNTEQRIDLRANSQLGIGKFILSSNRAYWGVKTGVNNNLERFSDDSSNRNTWEAYLGTEVNLYDIGDLNLSFLYMGYSGLTDTGRYRADINFDAKYDLPLDFFVRMGVSLNYDNQPAENASDTDYIVRTGIGWEW